MATADEEVEGPKEDERQFLELRPAAPRARAKLPVAPARTAPRRARWRRGLAVGLSAAVLVLLVTAALVLRGGDEARRETASVEPPAPPPAAPAPVEVPAPPQAPSPGPVPAGERPPDAASPSPAAEPEPASAAEPAPAVVPPPAPKPVARPLVKVPAAAATGARARGPARPAPPAVDARAVESRPEPAAVEPAPVAVLPTPAAKEPEPAAAAPAPSTPARRLAPASVERAIARKKASFDQCVDQALAGPGGEALAGRKIALLIAVERGGLVEAAQVEQPEIESSPLGACLRRAAGGLLFPPFEGEPMGVRIPLQLGAPDARAPR